MTRTAIGQTPMRILIVDAYDERDMYGDYLRAHGFDVRMAATARDGIAAVKEQEPHAVIVGAVLPDLPGERVVARIKRSSRSRSTPVLMLTGFFDGDHLKRFQACGADAVVLKPCLPEQLLRHVRRLIAGRVRRSKP